jgi:hypothetical protein
MTKELIGMENLTTLMNQLVENLRMQWLIFRIEVGPSTQETTF